jgi:hypothetical protein
VWCGVVWCSEDPEFDDPLPGDPPPKADTDTNGHGQAQAQAQAGDDKTGKR